MIMRRAVSLILIATMTCGGNFALAGYHPGTGRFLQRDPIATGQPVVANMPFHGQTPYVNATELNPPTQYSDGMNLFQFVGSNPTNSRDPLGTFGLLDTFNSVATQAYVRVVTMGPVATSAFRFAGGLLAAANVYFLMTSPEYQDLVFSQPDAGGFVRANFELGSKAIAELLKTGGSAKAFLTASESTVNLANKAGAYAAGAGANAANVANLGKAILPPGTPANQIAGAWPAVLKNGQVYAARFHVQDHVPFVVEG